MSYNDYQKMSRFDMNCNGPAHYNGADQHSQQGSRPSRWRDEDDASSRQNTITSFNNFISNRSSYRSNPPHHLEPGSEQHTVQSGHFFAPKDRPGSPLGLSGGMEQQLSITSADDDVNRARKINLVRHLLRQDNEPQPSLTELQQRRRSSVFRFNRRKRKTRLFNKSGSTNAKFVNIKHRGHRFMADIFTTVVDMKWRWLMLTFILAFNFTWALFGFFWWLIMYFHEDFDHFDDPQGPGTEEWEFCLKNTRSYVGAFLFSLETQTTIGYGYRVISEKCSEGIILLIIQSILAAFFESVLIGMVLAKASRAKKRAETVVFSKMACIGMYDGALHFTARVGDIRSNSFLVEAHVRMYLIKPKLSEDHDYNPIQFYDMDVGYDAGLDRILIIAPILLRHKIDESSPLYTYSKSTFSRHDFEIVVIVEGAVEQTGMTTQMRTSYTPDEILWGHYFKQMIVRERGQYMVNFGAFDAVYEHETLPYSAEDLDRLKNGEEPEEDVPSDADSAKSTKEPVSPVLEHVRRIPTPEITPKRRVKTIRFRVSSVSQPSIANPSSATSPSKTNNPPDNNPSDVIVNPLPPPFPLNPPHAGPSATTQETNNHSSCDPPNPSEPPCPTSPTDNDQKQGETAALSTTLAPSNGGPRQNQSENSAPLSSENDVTAKVSSGKETNGIGDVEKVGKPSTQLE